MPVINLIQEQRLAHQRLEQKARIALLTLIGTGAIAIFGYGIFFFQAEGLKSEITRLDSDLKTMKPIIAEIESNEKDESLLSPRLKTLEEAQNQTNRWAHILQHFRTQTPANTWLTAMQATAVQKDKPTTLVIQGTAKGQEPIGEFILRVENEPDLQNVLLHFTQEKKSANGKAIDFELAAEIAGTEEQKKTVQEDKKS